MRKALLLSLCTLWSIATLAQSQYIVQMKAVFLDNFPGAEEIILQRPGGKTKRAYQLKQSDFPADKTVKSNAKKLKLSALLVNIYGIDKELSDDIPPIKELTVIGDLIGSVMEKEIREGKGNEFYELKFRFTEKKKGTDGKKKFYSMAFLVKVKKDLNNSISTGIEGRLLIGEKEMTPLKNEEVLLKVDNQTLAKTKTNKSGNFILPHVFLLGRAYEMIIPNPEINKEGNIYLADKNGNNPEKFEKVAGGFHYTLLPPIITKLRIIEEADGEMNLEKQLGNFAASNHSKMAVVENINYPSGAWELTNEAKSKLDMMASTLTTNTHISVKIISHTDAQGSSQNNLTLSQKRAQVVAEYLSSKGVAASQLSSEGLGESNILNRCKDGATCTDQEHAQNRRTEFQFKK